jgi:hypothetical protein
LEIVRKAGSQGDDIARLRAHGLDPRKNGYLTSVGRVAVHQVSVAYKARER